MEESDVVEIVMSNLMSHNEGDLFIGSTNFVKATGEIDVTPGSCERIYLIHPGNLHGQPVRGESTCLQTPLHSPDTINRPCRVLECHGFTHLRMQPFTKAGSSFELKVMSHFEQSSLFPLPQAS